MTDRRSLELKGESLLVHNSKQAQVGESQRKSERAHDPCADVSGPTNVRG